MELQFLFKQWLESEGLAKLTVRDYLNCLSRFPVQDFSQENVNMFLRTSNRLTNRAFITNLKDFMCLTYPERHEEYSKITMPRLRGSKKRTLPDFPTEEELLKIESAFDKEREKIMLLISFYSALRPQGIIKIVKSNFYLDKWLQNEDKPCTIKINEKGNKERLVLLESFVMKRIKDKLINAQPNDRLFNIGYRRWYKLLTDASKKALGRSISPHKLRHGGATWLLITKKYTLQEVSEFLGHESIATTQIYAHLDKGQMEDKYSNKTT